MSSRYAHKVQTATRLNTARLCADDEHMPITEQQEAALQRLVAGGELTGAQADAVRREFAGAAEPGRAWVIEVIGYLGGGLMIAGAALLLANRWEELGTRVQSGLLAGIAVVFVLAAMLIAEGRPRQASGARRRAAAVLLSLTAIPAGFAAGIAAPEPDQATWGFLTALVVSLACLAVLAHGLGIVVAGVATGSAVSTTMYEVFDANELTTGLVMLAAGALWTAVALYLKRPLALAIGFILAVSGAQYPVVSDDRVWAYSLTFAIAVACLALYGWQRSPIMLAGGVIAVTLAVPEAIYDFTDGALGGAAIVLIAGLVLVAASIVAARIHRNRATT